MSHPVYSETKVRFERCMDLKLERECVNLKENV